jgi:predicted small metal-binding protein
MSMRVVECNVCGEPLAAATDDELAARLRAHMNSEHVEAQFDEDAARKTVAAEAYAASDS